MAIIDAHAHIYPHKIASKAVDAVGDFYNIEMYGKGTAEHLLETKSRAPLTHFIVHSVATSANAVESINDFIAEQCRAHPEFIGFMAMHQDYPNPEKEIERAMSMGLKGMKLHPDSQHVNMDDPRLMKVYEIIEGRLPVAIHTGDYRYDYSHPRRLVEILRAFPNLVVDAAHFGCWSRYEVGYDVLHNAENLFVDASSAQLYLGQRRTRELTRMWGTDRGMFGSDYPMWDPASELNQFMGAGFTDDELDNLLWHNAERFAGVKLA